MATTNLTVTGFNANTGWVGTATDMATSNDVRVTDGVAGDTFDAALTDAISAVDTTNSVVINVEARTLGTVSKQKQLLLTLFDAGNVQLAQFATTDITATDAVYTSTVLPVVDTAADVNGWYIRAAITEGGGMGDTATVEIDNIFLTLDYNIAPQFLTASLYTDPDDLNNLHTVTRNERVDPTLYTNPNTVNFVPVITTGPVDLNPTTYTDPDNFFSHSLAVNITSTLFQNIEQIFAPRLQVLVSPSLYDGSVTNTFNSPVLTLNLVATSLDDSTDTFFAGGLITLETSTTRIESTNAFFSPVVEHQLNAATYTDPESIYTPSLSLNLTGTFYVNGQTFYNPTVKVFVRAPRIESTNTFNSPVVEHVLVGSGVYTNPNTFYGANITPTYDMTVTSIINSTETIYSGITLTDIGINLTHFLYTNPDTFGPHVITKEKQKRVIIT